MSKGNRRNRNLPTHQQAQSVPGQRGHSISIEGHYSAPIPPPNMVREYEAMHPGFLDRWMQTVEREQSHDHAVQNQILEAESTLAKRGQVCALVIGLVGLLGGIYLFLDGHDVGGGIVVGGTLVSLVTAFLKSQSSSAPEESGPLS